MPQFKQMACLALGFFCLALPAFAQPAASIFIDSPGVAIRAGESVSLALSPPEELDADWSYQWRATLGEVEAAATEAQFTAGEEPGYAVVSADILDQGQVIATRYIALLVYRQFIIVKADDLVSYDTTYPDTWRKYFEYMSEDRGLKHSAGLITKSLENTTLAETTDYTANIRAQDDSGLVEIWHHGFDHSGPPDEGPPPELTFRAPLQPPILGEFSGRPYAYQKSHLDDGMAYAQFVAGITLRTFGPPYGLADATTVQVLDENPIIEVVFAQPPGTTKRLLPVDELLVEVPTGYPSFSQFQARHSPAAELEVLQIHPGFTEQDNSTPFIDRFAEWQQIVAQLESESATFILPYEYHQLFEDRVLPLHPLVDSDGDGATDLEEGNDDENGDGLPDFLDARNNGGEGLRVRNVEMEETSPGQYVITFDLIGQPSDVADLEVVYVQHGNEIALEDFTGATTGLSPAEGLTLSWDAAAQLGQAELQGLTVAITPRTATPANPELIPVEESIFTQGCAACTSGDSIPAFEVKLDDYAIGKYEITNAEFAAAMNHAQAQGYLRDDEGDPYTGGDVFFGGQMLIGITSPDCQIIFDSGTFIVEERDSLPMDSHPVACVTWYGAVTYCNLQSEMAGLTAAYELGGHWRLRYPYTNGYRLPTEAEWERAAAWDGDSAWLYGFSADAIDDTRANYDEANPLALSAEPFTTPVGYFNGANSTADSASPVGLYDMSGNVAEWVHDRFGPYAEQEGPLHNPRGIDTRPKRVVRGGAWSNAPAELEAAAREARYANHSSGRVGFRIARSLHSGTGRSAPFAIDSRPPEIASILLNGNPAPDDFSISYTITFTESVTGLSQEHLILATTGEVETAPTITEFSGSGPSYTVTVDTGFMLGDVSLRVEDPNAEIVDAAGNPVSNAPQESLPLALDTISPRALDITLVGSPAVNAATLDFDVSFSKPVVAVVPEDFAIDTTGLVVEAPQITAITGDGATRRVTLAVNIMEGALGLRLADADASIQDAASRPLASLADSGFVHTADTRAPAVSAITIAGSPAPNAAFFSFNIAFTEDVTGIARGNLSIEAEGETNATPQILFLTGSGASYSASISATAADATLRLVFDSTAGIEDDAGNALNPDIPEGASIHIDNLPPEFVSLELVGEPPANAATLEYLVTFSEAMTGVDEEDFLPFALGTTDIAPTIASVTAAGPVSYTVLVDTGEVEGTSGLRFEPEGASDIAGNPLDGIHDSTLHGADTRPPRLLSAEAVTPSPTAAGQVQFRFVFSEPVSGLNGNGDDNLDITANGVSYASVSSAYDQNLFTILTTIGGLSTGSGSIAALPKDGIGIDAGTVADQNGNLLAEVNIDAPGVAIDRTPPEPDCRAVILDLDEAGTASPVLTEFDDGSTDDSGGEVTVLSVNPASFTCDDLGTNQVVVTFSDALGNTATCNSFVVVRDPLDACAPPPDGEEGEATIDGEAGSEGIVDGDGDGNGGGEGEGGGEAAPDGEGEGEGADGEGGGEASAEGEGEEGEGDESITHSADWHGTRGVLDLTELVRVIQLYNAGGLCCGEGETEDGFAVGPCAADNCSLHSADFSEPSWDITLSELLRVVQLFNLREFIPCGEGESEDGFCPVAGG